MYIHDLNHNSLGCVKRLDVKNESHPVHRMCMPYTLSMFIYVDTGILRCLACGDNWVAVGSNSGTVNTLDLRMGELLHHWKPSDYSVIPVGGYLVHH